MMNFCLKLLFCLLINIVFTKEFRIIGGENAYIKDFPYMASFRLVGDNSKQICGGAIISNHHIITAAHCFMGLNKKDVIIYIGSTYLPPPSEIFYKIQQIKIHPKFVMRETPSDSQNDIAIVTVNPCIHFNEFQHKIYLPKNDIKSGAFAVITGWGRTSYPIGQSSRILQKALMIIVTNDVCGKNLPFQIHEQNICAFQSNGVGACYGDSGGPLVSNGVLVGISSFIHPCAIGEPDVYTKVYSYLNFIKSTISSPLHRLLKCI